MTSYRSGGSKGYGLEVEGAAEAAAAFIVEQRAGVIRRTDWLGHRRRFPPKSLMPIDAQNCRHRHRRPPSTPYGDHNNMMTTMTANNNC